MRRQTKSRIGGSITSAHVLAFVALFVALGGGAYAATKLKPNVVKSKQVKDNSLKGVDINETTLDGSIIPGIPTGGGGGVADGAGTGPAGGDLAGNYPNPTLKGDAVTSAKIAGGAVGTSDLADGSVDSAKIADGAVGTIDLAIGAVTQAKLADGNVTNSKLSDGSVNSAKIADGNVALGDLAGDSVNSSKIVNDSVTGTDVDESTLNGFVEGTADVVHKSTQVGTGTTNGVFTIPGVGEIDAVCNNAGTLGAAYQNTSGATQAVSFMSMLNSGGTVFPLQSGSDLADSGVQGVTALGASDSYQSTINIDRGSSRGATINISGYENGATTCALQFTAVVGN